MAWAASAYQQICGELAERAVRLFSQRGITLALAESCTGGRIASSITAVPGASEVLTGAVVAYANSVKQSVLRVEERLLLSYGAVSEECAVAMAQGAQRVLGASWAVATTGVAGPGGGSREKPVGLVHFAVMGPQRERQVAREIFDGHREQIQWQAAVYALNLLLRVMDNPSGLVG